MTPGNLGGKGGNLAVELLRRIEALERTVQQVPSRFLPRTGATRFAKIAWRFTTAHNVNLSEGELVRPDGAELAEELIWIGPLDAVSVNSTDLYRESVPLVGNTAIYEVELVEREHDRGGDVRDLYAVVRRVRGGVQPISAKIVEVTDADPSLWLGKLCSDAAATTVITTTLAGAAKDNHAIVLDAFAETLIATDPVLLLGLIQGDLWLTERRMERMLGLPSGAEDGVATPTDGQVAVARDVDGRLRWVPEDPAGAGGGVPAGADPLDFLRVDAAGTAVEGQPLGDIDYDVPTDTIFTVATNLAVGPDGGTGRIYVANASMIAWIYEGTLALATEKHAEMSISAGKVNYKDNGVLQIEWSCHATDATARLYDFKIAVAHSGDVTLKAAKKIKAEATAFFAFEYATGPSKLATITATTAGPSYADDGTEVMLWTTSATAGSREFEFKLRVLVAAGHRTELRGDVSICDDDKALGFFEKTRVVQQTVGLPDVPTSDGEDPSGFDTVDLIVIQHMLDDLQAQHAQIAEIIDKLGQGSLGGSGTGYGLFKHV